MMKPIDLTDDYAKSTCRIGQGAACCRYLTMSPKGWECQKHQSLRGLLDQRVSDGTINARGDNCEGVDYAAL